jgi:signal transduction histidine kinase
MKRLRWVWPVFGLCLAVLLAGMAWISYLALDLYRTQQAAARQADQQERIRLALWRLDTAVLPIILRESSRPYYAYQPFHRVERAYSEAMGRLDSRDVLQPSHLLTFESPEILLHFQLAGDELTSPEAPTGRQRRAATDRFVSPERVVLAEKRLDQLRSRMEANSLLGRLPPAAEAQPLEALVRLQKQWDDQITNRASQSLPDNRGNEYSLNAANNEPLEIQPTQQGPQQARQPRAPRMQQQMEQSEEAAEQIVRNAREYQARDLVTSQGYLLFNYDNNAGRPGGKIAGADLRVREGPFKSLWLGDALLLARRVRIDGGEVVQGCWLDWSHLQQWLGGMVTDLLEGSRLEPMRPGQASTPAHGLSALPVHLVPAESPTGPAGAWAPVHWALVIAWGCVLTGAAVVAGVLIQAVRLSERRGAFVSAVTHEMRTPLTTFRLYSEMLSEGMVTDEQRRQTYLQRLRGEADRLHHLVDNVLAYARLSGPRRRARVETIALASLVEGMFDRLETCARRGQMDLLMEAEDKAASCRVRVDPSAIEQILLNLVDNACKYAARGDDTRLHLRLGCDDRRAWISLTDHGPGIDHHYRPKLFRPFSKSAGDAAGSAPGIGLGLALSRRLARTMNGRLRLDEDYHDGARFVLELPLAGESAHTSPSAGSERPLPH